MRREAINHKNDTVNLCENIRCFDTIDGLINCWKEDWRILEKIKGDAELEFYGRDFNNTVEQTIFGFEQLLNWDIDSVEDVSTSCCFEFPRSLYLSFYSGHFFVDDNCRIALLDRYKKALVDNDRNRKKCHIFLDAFIKSESYIAAIKKSLPQKMFSDFISTWDKVKPYLGKKTRFSETLEIKIPLEIKSCFQWLKKGLENSDFCKQSFWNIVWILMQPKVKHLIKIQHMISNNLPISNLDIDFINEQLLFGAPILHIADKDGQIKPDISMKLNQSMSTYGSDSIESACNIILIQPAFNLALQLSNDPFFPKYISICRAPSCNKHFYTARNNATACPANNSQKKSKCALEWIRYKRYLEKIKKTPEQDWNNKNLQEQFMKYDVS